LCITIHGTLLSVGTNGPRQRAQVGELEPPPKVSGAARLPEGERDVVGGEDRLRQRRPGAGLAGLRLGVAADDAQAAGEGSHYTALQKPPHHNRETHTAALMHARPKW